MSVLNKEDTLQHRYHELENENNILKYELEQKAQILSQVTKELSQIQIQYKQSIDKIVELSSKKEDKKFNNIDQHYYDQMNYQAQCIDNLQERLWASEYPSNYDYCREFQISQNKNIQKYLDYQNNLEELKYKSDKKMKYYENCICQLKKEIKKWKSFAIRVFDISADALDIEPEFPKHDSRIQRQITVELVEQLAKKKADDTQIQKKYQLLQNRYNSLSQYLNKVKFQCNKLTEKTQNYYNPIDRVGNLSQIEEFVKQDHYYKEPVLLRNNQDQKRKFSLESDNDKDEDDLIRSNQSETENSSKNYSDLNNHVNSSLSSFDNSFESIKNLVKSFQKQYKKEDHNQIHSKSPNSSRKKIKNSNLDEFSFESN